MMRPAQLANMALITQTPQYTQPSPAFRPVITTQNGLSQEMAMQYPNIKLTPNDFVAPVEVINKKPKKRNPLDGETIKELSNNIVELTPNIKEVRKVIKKMVNLIEMDDMDKLQF